MVSANREAAARWDTVIVTGEGSWTWQGNLCTYIYDRARMTDITMNIGKTMLPDGVHGKADSRSESMAT